MSERCLKVQELLGVRVSRVTLAKYYKQAGIRYRKAGYRYYTTASAAVKLEEQRKFVFRLGQHMQ